MEDGTFDTENFEGGEVMELDLARRDEPNVAEPRDHLNNSEAGNNKDDSTVPCGRPPSPAGMASNH